MLLCSAVLLSTSVAFAFSDASQTVSENQITLKQIVEKVSNENYLVLENALRTYQSKEAIHSARANLLPSLNVWRVISVVFEPTSMVGMIEDVAPFLVPGNWLRLKEQKLLHQAEMQAYRALWANEVMTAKALFVNSNSDLNLLRHVGEIRKEMEDLLLIVRTREMMGVSKPGLSRDLEIRILALKEDERALKVLVDQELDSLSYILGIQGNVSVTLEPLQFPDFEKLEPLSYEDFEFRALDNAPEVKQFDYILAAADYVKKEVYWSVLGTSTASRGVSGGVFDDIPIQSGLGFGAGPAIEIIKAKKESLKLQKRGVVETLKRQLQNVVRNYNLDLENYSSMKRRVQLSLESLEFLKSRIRLGEDIDILELIEASRNHMQAETAFAGVKARFLTQIDRLERLLFASDYEGNPPVIEHGEAAATTGRN
ncbi:MAG TPA: hypothetical protein DCS07_16400 [Bdellovibrionales bacterium]|nr:MAG: hypothetical protein A2070_01055 [Bdellovibrionales bacterium GWC1_52_8]HAR44186.1 hypothetical protein [Bdellovibrionales bacterium]